MRKAALLTLLLALWVIWPADAAMKVFWQWARATPQDWVLGSSTTFGGGAKKTDPIGDVGTDGFAIGDSLLNNQPGWILALNVQGVLFEGADHFAVEDLTDGSNGILVTVWFDDPIWFPPGLRHATVWTILPLANQPGIGLNTRQSQVRYCDTLDDQCRAFWGSVGIPALEYGAFVPPPDAVTKHGIWLPDAKWNEHIAARTLHGWREWTE